MLSKSFSGFDPGCVKTPSGKGGAESFSQLPSSESSCQHKPTLTSTKSRWKFYTEVGHRSFHTAWVKAGKARYQHMFSALPRLSRHPESRHYATHSICPFRASNRLIHRSKWQI